MSGKRKRQPNFSAKEKLELFSIISQKYGKIIENKVTDKVSMSEKESAWNNIEKDFNATNSSGLFRDKDCLKRFYDNRKREVRKLKAQERQELIKTGGGPETKFIIDVADELLIQIMNSKTVEGLSNNFDCDEFTVSNTNADKDANTSTLDQEKFEDNLNLSVKLFKKADDLKRPKDPALRPLHLNNTTSNVGTNIIILECENEKWVDKKNVLSEHSTELDTILGTPIEHPSTSFTLHNNPCTSSTANDRVECAAKQEKVYEGIGCLNTENIKSPVPKSEEKVPKARKAIAKSKKMTTLHGPRRSGIQILASSHSAKKYDELLDQRKVLLDKQIEIANQDLTFGRAKNNLEVEILTLKLAKEKKDKN